MTIRDAADRADGVLRGVRPLVRGRFEQRGGSLWLAKETYILHFRLLRVLDTLTLAGRILDDLKPASVVCAGPVRLVVSEGIPNLRLQFEFDSKKLCRLAVERAFLTLGPAVFPLISAFDLTRPSREG